MYNSDNQERDVAMKRTYLAPLAAVLLAAGCAGPQVWVTVRPPFDCQKIAAIAVPPFKNESRDPDAGRIFANKLAALLAERGPYKVIYGEQLPGGAAPTELSPQALKDLAGAAGADAVLAGTVMRYASDRYHEVRFYDEPFTQDEGIHEMYYDEAPVDWFKIDAAVEASVRLIETATGKVLWSDTRMATSSDYGSPPKMSEPEVLDRAADSVAGKLLLGLVPHQERVRVPRGSLTVCGDYIDHPLDIRSTFTPRDEALYLVIELDSEFAGNKIALGVEKLDTRSSIVEDSFAWDGAKDSRVFRKEMRDLIAIGGYGKYRASYAIDGVPAAHADFTLREK